MDTVTLIDDRQATNGAGLYEDAAKLKITVTEGADLNWLLLAAARRGRYLRGSQHLDEAFK